MALFVCSDDNGDFAFSHICTDDGEINLEPTAMQGANYDFTAKEPSDARTMRNRLLSTFFLTILLLFLKLYYLCENSY